MLTTGDIIAILSVIVALCGLALLLLGNAVLVVYLFGQLTAVQGGHTEELHNHRGQLKDLHVRDREAAVREGEWKMFMALLPYILAGRSRR